MNNKIIAIVITMLFIITFAYPVINARIINDEYYISQTKTSNLVIFKDNFYSKSLINTYYGRSTNPKLLMKYFDQDKYFDNNVDTGWPTCEISGPSEVDINQPVTFKFLSNSYPGDIDVRFIIDWKKYPEQDFEEDKITEYCKSGEWLEVNHIFDVGGDYYIVARAEDAEGSLSEITTFYVSVKGGKAELCIDDVYTTPDKFRPSQEVKICFSYGNCGDQDYHGAFTLHIYFDNKRITPMRVHYGIIEANKFYEYCTSYTWPNDLDLHEIRADFSGVSFSITKQAINEYPDLTCTKLYSKTSEIPGLRHFVYTVTNIGGVSVKLPDNHIPILVTYENPDGTVDSHHLPPDYPGINYLESGESYTFDSENIYTIGILIGTKLSFKIDPENVIDEGEYGEDNNLAQLKISRIKNSNLQKTKMLEYCSLFEKILNQII